MELGKIIRFGTFDTKQNFPFIKETEPRRPENFEFEFFLSCNGTSFIDDQRYKLYPRTVILRKPEQTSRSILGFRCLYFHLHLEKSSPYYTKLNALPNYYPIIAATKYERIFKELIDHLTLLGVRPNDDFVVAKLLELFYYLQEDAVQNQTPAFKSSLHQNECLSKTVAYMHEKYGEKLSLQRLADIAGYSPNYFESIFKITFHCTPQTYLEEIRLNKAKQMLASPNLSIAEITYECGFTSQSYFAFLFRKKHGITPREYRKNTLSRYIL